MDQPIRPEQSPTIEVRRSPRRRRTVTAYRDGSSIIVLLPQAMSKADERRFVDDMVRKVLAREARRSVPDSDRELAARASDLAARYLAPVAGSVPVPSQVAWVTNQSKRWGSCTPSSRTIRLSHRLQQMPQWVIDYVLVHELAHLVETDHTARFWRLVESYPEASRARGFLEGFLAGQGRTAADPDAD